MRVTGKKRGTAAAVTGEGSKRVTGNTLGLEMG